jgi:extracellular matrix regulatory protein A
VKRMVQDARDRGTLVDASSGRKTRSVLLMDSDHVILSSVELEVLKKELSKEK